MKQTNDLTNYKLPIIIISSIESRSAFSLKERRP